MNTNKLSQKKNTAAHRLATATALIGTAALAVASFILSFTALTDLVSERSPIPASLAWLWAVSLDGLIVVATVALVALARRRRRERVWAAFLLLAGVALSTAGNVAHALIEGFGITGALISALPPVLLASITHLSVSLMRAPAEVEEVSAQPQTVSAQDERAQDDADRDVSAAYERTLDAVNDAMSAHEDERERAVEDERAHEQVSAAAQEVSAHEERTPLSVERAASERSDTDGRTPAHLTSPSTSSSDNSEVLSFLQEALSEGREPTGSDIGARFGVSAATGRRWKKAAMAQLSERELATAA
jgi:hypothetical protein